MDNPKVKPDVTYICFKDLKPTVEGLMLNIGSGDNRMAGYINVDRYNANADVNWDAGHLPLNDCTVSMIQSHQTMEHFGHHELAPIAREWYRVCKQGGEVHVTTPDIVESCKLVVANPNNGWYLSRIFGNQSHDGQHHKWGFTVPELTTLFGNAGFADVSTMCYPSSDGTTYLYTKAVR